MAGEAAEKKLYDAASKGDVTTFQQLLHQDPNLLDGISFACSNRTPLHIATMQGNLGIVVEVLKRNPQLARELDAQRSSPLHIAAAEGYVEIASLLLLKAPHMCWMRDCHGMNPVHIAAMNGHVEILEELIRRDHLPAMEKVDRGQTVLHLCVKHRQIKALEVLLEILGELGSTKDDDGETIMDLALRINLFKRTIDLIREKQSTISEEKTSQQIIKNETHIRTRRSTGAKFRHTLKEFYLKKQSDVTMVVVILIATMAFQAVVSPPGGVWQDDTSAHGVGEAVMASSRPKIYKYFVHANTAAFVTSLITIFMVTTGLPSTSVLFSLAVTLAMWVSMASIGVSYGASVMVITPDMETRSLARFVTGRIVAISLSLFGLCILGFLITRMLWRLIDKCLASKDPSSLPHRVATWIFAKIAGESIA